MNPREKKLLWLVGGVLVLFLGIAGVRAVLMKPLREMDRKTAALRGRIEKVNAERRAAIAAEDTVKRFARQTFSDQIDQASAKSGEMLTQQILRSGLREADFSRLPVGPRRLRGANEIGWSVQGQGKLSEVIDLIFLLQHSPYLHRIENVTLSAGEAPGRVRVGFRFLTLVLAPAPVVESGPLENKVTLDGPERQVFDGIVGRDILRPYVKRAPDQSSPSSAPPPSSPGPGALRVVSLSEWMGQPEVHVQDLTSQKTLRYKIGDALADGTVVMVDYRPMPWPGNAGLMSFSRVILKIGNEYWAVERGQTLADKRRLSPEQWPESLPKL